MYLGKGGEEIHTSTGLGQYGQMSPVVTLIWGEIKPQDIGRRQRLAININVPTELSHFFFKNIFRLLEDKRIGQRAEGCLGPLVNMVTDGVRREGSSDQLVKIGDGRKMVTDRPISKTGDGWVLRMLY